MNRPTSPPLPARPPRTGQTTNQINIFNHHKSPLSNWPIKVCVVGVFSKSHSTNICIADAFEKHPDISEVVRLDYRQSMKRNLTEFYQIFKAISTQVDLVLICKGNGIDANMLNSVAQNCKVFLWFMDPYFGTKAVTNIAKQCHWRSCTGYEVAKLWERDLRLPVEHIIDGCHTGHYYPVKGVNKIYDVSFIGSAVHERQIIKDCLDKFKIKSHFFGPSFTDFVGPDRFREICNQSKICLNVSRCNLIGYTSLRLWSVLGCKSFVLTKNIPQMTKYLGLEEGTHIVTFHNLMDLKNKIIYYLEHEKERKKIANVSYKYVINNRTWNHAIQEIIDTVKNKLPTRM